MRKIQQYKGFIIAEEKNGTYPYHVFTKDEWSYGEGLRSPEWDADSIDECKEWIDSE